MGAFSDKPGFKLAEMQEMSKKDGPWIIWHDFEVSPGGAAQDLHQQGLSGSSKGQGEPVTVFNYQHFQAKAGKH